MAAVRVILGIICFAFFGQLIEPSGNFLGLGFRSLMVRVNGLETVKRKLPAANRKLILSIAQSQIGVREATGKNDGIAVEKYLQYTGNKKDDPWCASFVSWVYGQAGLVHPKTAWSPSLFPLARQTTNPLPADVFGVYFKELGRIAHCGLVNGRKGNWISTIEGNTNVASSREGDGVYQKLRHWRTIKVYADWLNEPRKERAR